MEKIALAKSAANGDAHIRFQQWSNRVGNLRIGIVSGRLNVDIGAPVADIACNPHNSAPWATFEIRLQPFANQGFLPANICERGFRSRLLQWARSLNLVR
jgi:hypothetical protein